ncbi:MAG: UbiD family decarboxylase, partial [Deltaproteobacteria bacterium]|nr:UbiD family decarboxylase [Deltaproteobacteria bacterium]
MEVRVEVAVVYSTILVARSEFPAVLRELRGSRDGKEVMGEMSKDFRGFLKEIEETEEGGFIRIQKEVDPSYEVAAIVTKLERKRKLPLLFFENVKGADMPVVVNCYATRSRVARGIGVPKEALSQRVSHAYKNPIPSVEVSDAPVQEVVHEGDDVDLGKLPSMIYHNTDGAPYITAGIVLAKDPDDGAYNLSYNRLMLKEKNRLGIFMTVGKHLNAIYSKMEQLGKPLEVAVSIGNHPAWAIGALAIGPYEEEELAVIGGLNGSPL